LPDSLQLDHRGIVVIALTITVITIVGSLFVFNKKERKQKETSGKPDNKQVNKQTTKMIDKKAKTIEYVLYSIAGNKCKEGSLENLNSILVNDLSNGLYQLVVINSNGSRNVLPIVISNQ
jgi:hypothetical protein